MAVLAAQVATDTGMEVLNTVREREHTLKNRVELGGYEEWTLIFFGY